MSDVSSLPHRSVLHPHGSCGEQKRCEGVVCRALCGHGQDPRNHDTNPGLVPTLETIRRTERNARADGKDAKTKSGQVPIPDRWGQIKSFNSLSQ